MHRHWMIPSGDEARDEIRRRVLFPQELERYAEVAGFEVLDMLDGTGSGEVHVQLPATYPVTILL
ncbi:hypothetical protein [Streptomyces phaeoluteigriseus]|uniref:hypothetical protein n=1 Tax=Streptomyces phaeoluteigriseus TaxID=114686 RepID=UPI0036BE7541